MSDDRPVHTDALRTLGKILTEPQGRDAIHIAVLQVKAGHFLQPGQRITQKDGIAVGTNGIATGIVDPFLKDTVQEGQMFWMLVLPRTITSLRHVWDHPLFPENK